MQKLNQKIVFTFNKKNYLCLLMCACNTFGAGFWGGSDGPKRSKRIHDELQSASDKVEKE